MYELGVVYRNIQRTDAAWPADHAQMQTDGKHARRHAAFLRQPVIGIADIGGEIGA